MPVKPRSNSGDAPETASDILLDEAAHFAAEGVWDLFGAKSDILGVRFPEDSEPWYTVFTGPGDGREIHEIESAVGGWLLLRGATGLRVAESIVHGADLAGDRPSSPLEFLALAMVPAENVSDEDADFAAEDLDVATTEFPVFRVREAGERLSRRPDATDQSRIARALSALRRACAAGDLPPLAWTDASAVPFVATLAADEPDGAIADEHAEFPTAPVSWERPRGDHVHAVSVPSGVAELPAGSVAWVAAFRVDTLGGAAAAEPTSSSATPDDDATPRPTADLFIVNVAGGPAIVADPSASVSPYALVRRVLSAIVAAGSRPASVAFEDHAAFAVAEATLRPLDIAVTECGPHAAIDPLAASAGARRRELDAIYNGEIVPRDDDGDGWDLVHLRAFEAIDDRLESEQKSISESFREYFGVRDDDLNPQVEELATDAFQEWRALRLNPSGDRRSPIDRILKSDEIGPADRVFLEALRGAKL
ncbi:MAG: hypothetical protein K8T90_21735 [Planctomycetes bacterium]|nr:hypothetical protein [Planctomycetota bacterium]